MLQRLLVFLFVAMAAPVIAGVLPPRQAPGAAEGVTTITSPGGSQIRYKQPGKDGICETTPGVNSYSGYIDIDPDVHVFFWFFESRRDPARDPVSHLLSPMTLISAIMTISSEGDTLAQWRPWL